VSALRRAGPLHADREADEQEAGTQGPLQVLCMRKQFTVTVGTVFEDSRIPINKWLLAIHLIGSSKKGMSAHQIHRNLGISYKAAWFMMHRLRYAMKGGPLADLMRALWKWTKPMSARVRSAARGAGVPVPTHTTRRWLSS
jgi:hypothetical protein